MTNTISSSDTAVYIGLGSNLGDRERNLWDAVDHLESRGFVAVKLSSIYETEPVGFKDQPWFLNQVIETQTKTVDPDAVLAELLDVEREMGRTREIVDGPRLIDIDLLLMGDVITGIGESSSRKTSAIVPHPRMHERRFVLEPLCEIAPEAIHPVLAMTCRELLASLQDSSIVKHYEPVTSNV